MTPCEPSRAKPYLKCVPTSEFDTKDVQQPRLFSMLPFFAPLLFLSAVLMEAAAEDCPQKLNDDCGPYHPTHGVRCCPSGQFCMPYDWVNFQCNPVPPKCPKQLPEVAFGGANISVEVLETNGCCKLCAKAEGCVGYTAVNYVGYGKNMTSYLLSSVTTSFYKPYTVSAMVDSAHVSLASSRDSAEVGSGALELPASGSWDSVGTELTTIDPTTDAMIPISDFQLMKT